MSDNKNEISEDKKLNILYLVNQGDKGVVAFSADLPDYNVANVTMRLRGPKNVDLRDRSKALASISGSPIYDDTHNQVLYIVSWTDPRKLLICNIGKYLEVSSIDGSCGNRTASDYAQPSVSFQGGFVSVVCPERFNITFPRYLGVWQNPKGSEWKESQRIDPGQDFSSDCLLITPPKELRIEYVYCFAQREFSNSYDYVIYTIRSTKFVELHADPNAKWERHELDTSLGAATEQPTVYVFTESRIKDKPHPTYNLLLFHFQRTDRGNAITLMTINLREDGSVIRPGGKVDTHTIKLSLPIDLRHESNEHLCAYIYNEDQIRDPAVERKPTKDTKKYVLLTWHRSTGFGSSKMLGWMTEVSDDGTVNDTKKWKTVSITFDKEVGPAIEKFSGGGVLVLSDFAGI